jgi:hypothetical protein
MAAARPLMEEIIGETPVMGLNSAFATQVVYTFTFTLSSSPLTESVERSEDHLHAHLGL